jgi:hypothetical protein
LNDDAAEPPAPLLLGEARLPTALMAERQHWEAVVADLRHEFAAEHAQHYRSEPAVARANGHRAATAAAGTKEDGAQRPTLLQDGENGKLAAQRQSEAMADLPKELDPERAHPLVPEPATIAVAKPPAASAAAGDADHGGQKPEAVHEDGDARPVSQKLRVDERQKTHPGGGRKRRPRHRESNRHISRH